MTLSDSPIFQAIVAVLAPILAFIVVVGVLVVISYIFPEQDTFPKN